MKWQAASQTDEDLIAARDFIAADNESAARDFLDAAFETFDRLAQFPKIGQRAHFKHRALRLIFTHRFIAGRRRGGLHQQMTIRFDALNRSATVT